MINQEETNRKSTQKPRASRLAAALIATAMISLLIGGTFVYVLTKITFSKHVDDLQNRLSELEDRVSGLQLSQKTTYENATYFLDGNVSLSQLYDHVRDSVVLVQASTVQYDFFGQPYYSSVQGSGFVSNITGITVVTTNYHVVDSAVNVTVTYASGNSYTASVIGSDAYADLAIVSVDAPQDEFIPLEVAHSSTLEVGDPVIAVGNPYGLAGSLTSGIVSALGRTITEDLSGGYPIANCIQTSTPINPGNSGGPLLNYEGEVIGITTAIVSDSQGIGFAIPSSTILRETPSLITTGSYNQHPWLGAAGVDMTYEIAHAMNVDITYGWLIVQVTGGGPAEAAGLRSGTQRTLIAGESVTIGGDIVTVIDGTRITNMDSLSTYLEEHTLPGQTINVTILRDNQTKVVAVELGSRPPSSN